MKKKYGIGWLDVLVAVLVVGLALYLGADRNAHVNYTSPSATHLTGQPYLIDGDSIVINHVEMRLIGMDTPELHQLCGHKESLYPCGVMAKEHLRELIDNQDITCSWTQLDLYHRALAVCFKDNLLLNRQMVLDGFAVNFYDYPNEEKFAKGLGLGIWSAPFQRPKDWRRLHPWKRSD